MTQSRVSNLMELVGYLIFTDKDGFFETDSTYPYEEIDKLQYHIK